MIEEDIIREVKEDFQRRRSERLQFESQWLLNTNFVLGNQYASINSRGEVEDRGKDYFWQEREVFNHIAAIVETRLAKLKRVRPKMSVRPASSDEEDLLSSRMSGKILSSACSKLNLDEIIARATMWSEIAGCSFYKIAWDNSSGKKVGSLKGKKVFEGEVSVDVCPPYEVFPDSLSAQTVDDCRSIIHAKAVPVSLIKSIWEKEVASETLDIYSLESVSAVGGLGVQSVISRADRCEAMGSCLVIERYSRPSFDKPEGELAIIAGDKLLYYGELPFINGTDGARDLPFIKQDALVHPGCFYGISMVERAIPIQRAYNAVKNRKHEFMNRIAMGVLAVEDGSVDTNNLEEEGLSPGKILVYRQGANPPSLLDTGRVPSDFGYEEDRLLSEFIAVSGVSEIMRSSSVPSSVTSGVALQLLVEQDDTRLSVTAESVKSAVKKLGQHILRLYKQFAASARLSRVVGEKGEVELVTWNRSDISCDDVVFDTENELNNTPATRQNMIFELLRAGLLNNEEGRLTDDVRYKILDTLGYEFLKSESLPLESGKNEKEDSLQLKTLE